MSRPERSRCRSGARMRVSVPSSARTMRSAPGFLLRKAGLISAGSDGAEEGRQSPDQRPGRPRSAAPMMHARIAQRRCARVLRPARGGRGLGDLGGQDLDASIADPRIEERVGQVDHQVDQHVDEREQQDDGLDGGIVAGQHGIDGQPAEAGDGEDRFRSPPRRRSAARCRGRSPSRSAPRRWPAHGARSTLPSVCPLARAVRM